MEHQRIKSFGFAVHVVDSKPAVNQFISIIRSLMP